MQTQGAINKDSKSERDRSHDGYGIYECRDCGEPIVFIPYVNRAGEKKQMPCNATPEAIALRDAPGQPMFDRRRSQAPEMQGVVSHFDTCTSELCQSWQKKARERQQRGQRRAG